MKKYKKNKTADNIAKILLEIPALKLLSKYNLVWTETHHNFGSNTFGIPRVCDDVRHTPSSSGKGEFTGLNLNQPPSVLPTPRTLDQPITLEIKVGKNYEKFAHLQPHPLTTQSHKALKNVQTPKASRGVTN